MFVLQSLSLSLIFTRSMSFLPRNQWNDPIKPILVKSRDLLVSTYNLRLKHDSSSNLLTKLLIERKLEIFVEIYTKLQIEIHRKLNFYCELILCRLLFYEFKCQINNTNTGTTLIHVKIYQFICQHFLKSSKQKRMIPQYTCL